MALRILVIEDDPDSLELITYLLRADGHVTLEARTGDQGMRAVAAETPDLVLCDLRLPGPSGYEIASRLKSDPERRGIPIVAVTAYAMPGDRERALRAGFDGYISKPIDPATFVSQAEAFAGHGHDSHR